MNYCGKMKYAIKIISAMLAVFLMSAVILPVMEQSQAEELMAASDYNIYIDDAESMSDNVLGVYTNGYDNKLYASLRDLAKLLSGTSKQFDFYMNSEADSYAIVTDCAYEEPETEVTEEPETSEGDYYDEEGNLLDMYGNVIMEAQEPAVRPDYEYLELYMNPLTIDGNEVRYYTYQLSAMSDIYMNVIDIQLALGITIEKIDSSTLRIYTDRGFDIDLDAYDNDGFFDLYNGVILGDATTGEILYGCKEDNADAIASTSKLMTYMIVARYMELGRISMDDVVTLSQNVENLAYSGYGTMYMDEGQQVTVHDLLAATLLASSNEAALALAEYVAGSEEEFVKMMNAMADLLGLDSARFYNANGLPVYSDSIMASKQQNMMSAEDLFRLTQVILRKYPQITEFTSQKEMYLESFDYTVSNTSYLLYNMTDAIGLKTGTTDEAGCCLVGAVRVNASDGEHILVAIVLGAESNLDRYQVPEILLTWGENTLKQ